MIEAAISGHSYVTVRNSGQVRLFTGRCPSLKHLDIELTERCNNSCIHCYINLPANDTDAKHRELTSGEWKSILAQAAALGALSVRFTGGEPLLRQDFPELYLYARHLGLKVILFTNGRLITPEIADLFSRVPPLKKLEISVYGMHPESYDAITRSPGAFAEFRRGLRLLEYHNIPFVVKSVLLPSNRAELSEFESWASGLSWMDRPPSYAVFLDLRTRRDSIPKNRLIRQLRLSPEDGVSVAAHRGDEYHREMADFSSRFMGPSGDRVFTCGAGESGCVDSYGKYQMCMLLRHPDTVYDLHKGTLREALAEFFPRVRQLCATNSAYLTRCARCFLKGLCEQCPGKSWSEHGTLDAPVEYLCQVAHAQAVYLGLLGEGEQAWKVKNWQERVERLRSAPEVL